MIMGCGRLGFGRIADFVKNRPERCHVFLQRLSLHLI
jgi:hypothetical protein